MVKPFWTVEPFWTESSYLCSCVRSHTQKTPQKSSYIIAFTSHTKKVCKYHVQTVVSTSPKKFINFMQTVTSKSPKKVHKKSFEYYPIFLPSSFKLQVISIYLHIPNPQKISKFMVLWKVILWKWLGIRMMKEEF